MNAVFGALAALILWLVLLALDAYWLTGSTSLIRRRDGRRSLTPFAGYVTALTISLLVFAVLYWMVA